MKNAEWIFNGDGDGDGEPVEPEPGSPPPED
jgi:hypothetical protein